MRIARANGRLAILDSGGAIDVEKVSGGLFSADPDRLFDRWDEFLQWAEGNLGRSDRVEPVTPEDLDAPLVAVARVNYFAGCDGVAAALTYILRS